MWGWGLNVHRFLPPIAAWGGWTVAAVSLHPSFAGGLDRFLSRLNGWAAHAKRSSWAIWVFGFLIVWLLPDRTWFVGDFLIRQGNVESNFFSGNYIGALPLDYFLHSFVLRPFGFGSIQAANTSLRLLGAIEAGFLALLAVAFSRAISASRIPSIGFAGLVFFGGYLTMFTGLGKPSSEMCLATLALATYGIESIQWRRNFIVFGFWMAFALALHRSCVLLIPVWLYVCVTWLRGKKSPSAERPIETWIGIGLPAVVALAMLPRVAAIARAYDFSHHVFTIEAAAQGGLLKAIVAPRHLIDLANLLLALCPLIAVVPVLLLSRPRLQLPRESALLGALCAPFVGALLIVQPQQGIFRDWDVFAPASVTLATMAAVTVREVLATTQKRGWLLASAFALVCTASLQWLILNTEADRGLSRVRAFLLEPPGPEAVDRPLLWDFLAARNMRLARWADAADAAEQAAKYAPHRRILLMWAISATIEEDYATAARAYQRMLTIDAEDPLAWLGLAGAAKRLGDEKEFQRALEKLRSYARDGPEMKMIRRHLQYYPQVWPLPSLWN